MAPLAIKSGRMKDAGSPFRALTPEERAVFQGVIDDMFGRFVKLVVQSRKIPETRVREFADGRIYTADQALSLGLVDRIAYLDEVLVLAKKAAGVEEARVVVYHRPKEYAASIYATVPLAPAVADNALTRIAGMLGSTAPASCTSGGPRLERRSSPVFADSLSKSQDPRSW